MTITHDVGQSKRFAPPKRKGLNLVWRKRIGKAIIIPLLVVYSVMTIFPFYVLFVRTFVGTKNSTEPWLWPPPAEEVSLDAEIGNLAVFLNLDISQFKRDMGISGYIEPRTTLTQISEQFNIPEWQMRSYFASYSRFLGWTVLFKDERLWPALTRTVLITIASMVGLSILTLMTGTALAGLKRTDQMIVFNLYLLQTIIPFMLIILPQFMIVQHIIGLIPGSGEAGPTRYLAQLIALILLEIQGGALPVMLFTAAISALPAELEESATLDGASRWRYIYHILLPLMRVPIASLIVIRLPYFWNLFFEPYVYLDNKNTTFLPLIQSFSGEYSTNFQVIYSAIFVSIVPLVLIYIIFRRLFVSGIMAGAIKG